MNNNPWFGVSMALVGVIVGYVLATAMGAGGLGGGSDTAPTPAAPTAPSAAADAQPQGELDGVDPNEDYIFGNKNAKFSLIEWSDAECPFCKRHHPTPKALIEKYGDDLNWVYRHYPLSFHPNAQKTAEAQECAGELGGNDAFWEYTDVVFEKGAVTANLASYGADIGLDTEELQKCIDSGKYAQKVKDHMASAGKVGVRGTPGNVIVNNDTGEFRVVSGAQPISNFESVIDQMMGN